MFQKLLAVSPTADAKTLFNPGKNWLFAANEEAVGLSIDEVTAIASEYAIVFSPQAPFRPLALLGTGSKNHYLSELGRWNAKQVPMALRIYPFGTASAKDKTYLVREATAPHFAGATGSPLFDRQGNPSTTLKEVTKMAQLVHDGMAKAVALCAQLAQAGLLKDGQIDVTTTDGRQHSFAGFKLIDEEALRALDAATRDRLTRSGAMALLVAHRDSLRNLNRLLPVVAAAPAAAKKPRKPRAPSVAAAAAVPKEKKPRAAAAAAAPKEAKPRAPRAKKAAAE